MRAAVITQDHRITVREFSVPSIGPDEILLKVRACGVCGTDIGKFKYRLTKHEVVLGHEVAGEVAEVGKGMERFNVGDRVVVAHHTPCYTCHYCRHESYSMCALFKSSNLEPGGFAQYLRIPALHARLTAHRIPDHLSFSEAIFMEPLACVLRNIKRTRLQAGDTCLVIGLGSMGLLTVQSLKAQGIRVIGSDLKDDRRMLAKSLGIDAAVSGDPKDVQAACFDLSETRGVDAVILTSGNEHVYSGSTRYIRDGGTISIFAGQEPGKTLQLDINDIYKRELTILSSYSPSPIELVEALEYLSEKKVLTGILTSKNFALDQLETAIEEVASQAIMKAIITP